MTEQEKKMNKIEYALKLAKDCTYADEITEGAKEHLRNEIDLALKDISDRDQFAIGFAEWMSTEGLSYYVQLGIWSRKSSDKAITAPELLDLYKQSLTKTDKG